MSSIVEFRVEIDCSGCESKVRKALLKLDGVDEVEIDMRLQKVSVTGWADQNKIQKAIMKTGLRVEPWTMPYIPQLHDFNHFYKQHKTFKLTANTSSHRKKGKIIHERTFDPQPLIYEDTDAFAIFNDDNPSGCSIM
ncbi:heavy metal-associated isoprenylated plant protein 45-like [Amaranthus tricolor]|uniref:heavy metal-associated isoprenylated plant protein 45-like n=1 Tax=Amaranthus tricolor TaxID=29722 RepID=UPI00258E2E61|nr:heavy metal-associated isoprenylated plant protein 45-like [Amaranthus tricolor]